MTVVRPAFLAAALSVISATAVTAQRSGGTMGGLPRLAASPAAAPAMPSLGRGTMATPGWGYAPRTGDLPRIVTDAPRRGAYGYGSAGYGRSYGGISSYGDQRSGTVFRRAPYARWGANTGCGVGCVYGGAGFHKRRVHGSFVLGYPYGLYLPYVYGADYYSAEYPGDAYVPAPEPERPASKLIVVGGGSAGGGDALTVETLGDSVRLRWLANGRPAREVKLFVADSARRELASRSASPSAPVATFEVVTLSAPVAFTGVTITFADGVTSTTMVPYQQGAAGQRR